MEDLNYMVNTWTSPYGLPPGEVIRLDGAKQTHDLQAQAKQSIGETFSNKIVDAPTKGDSDDVTDVLTQL